MLRHDIRLFHHRLLGGDADIAESLCVLGLYGPVELGIQYASLSMLLAVTTGLGQGGGKSRSHHQGTHDYYREEGTHHAQQFDFTHIVFLLDVLLSVFPGGCD